MLDDWSYRKSHHFRNLRNDIFSMILLYLTKTQSSWWLFPNPFEKYSSNWIISPRFRVNIKHIWNHQPAIYLYHNGEGIVLMEVLWWWNVDHFWCTKIHLPSSYKNICTTSNAKSPGVDCNGRDDQTSISMWAEKKKNLWTIVDYPANQLRLVDSPIIYRV